MTKTNYALIWAICFMIMLAFDAILFVIWPDLFPRSNTMTLTMVSACVVLFQALTDLRTLLSPIQPTDQEQKS